MEDPILRWAQICSVYQALLGPSEAMRYVVGCSSIQLCNTISGMKGNTMCSECCNTTLCNNQLCSTKTTAPIPTSTTPEITTQQATTPAIHLFEHPPVVTMNSQTSVQLGLSFALTCRFSGSGTLAATWYFNGHRTLPHNAVVANHRMTSKLSVSSSEEANAGTYKCEVSNIYGTAAATSNVVITGVKPAFIERPPAHLDMVTNGDYSATCRASGLPKPTIHFLHQSMAALSAIYTNQEQTVLYISDPSMDLSEGHVTCTYENSYGSISTNMTLTVHQATTTPPRTTHQPTTLPIDHVPLAISLPGHLNVQLGSDVVIPCNATGSPTPQITWSQVPGRFPSNVEQHGNSLYITNASAINSLIFMCSATNIHGNTIKLIRVNVQGVPPYITTKPVGGNVTHGETVLMVCQATGNPKPTISWGWQSKANDLAVDGSILRQVPGVSIHDSQLTISNAFELHSGVYICTASNAYGTVTADANLNVISAHVNVAPHLLVTPILTSTLYGSDVTINYTVTGDPTPSVSCLYNKASLPPNVRLTDTQLLVIKATNDNNGIYQCNAHNIEGSETATFQISVVGMSPTFLTKPVTTTVLFGSSSRLTCSASGVPTPSIRWEYQSVSGSSGLPAGSSISPDHTTMTIKSTQNSGTFICHAENAYGQATAQASILVKTSNVIVISKLNVNQAR
ncbi:hemicentin-2-like [Ylistrum balloti]|uniref:hemicentin-2-like n=1 Tax=Ylistrum balloti TaxID=509963 RepID=UPI002905B998|nr:hemicentin-2-like [Ylistrum balloti]